MVQDFVTPLRRDLATRQNSPSLRNGSMERRATEKAQSKIYQLLFMWRIEQKELQKQKIREQSGFVPPSRLGINQSERIATEISKIYQLLFMWRIEHEELQKQKIREQPGFVPPSRLGTNQSERRIEHEELQKQKIREQSGFVPPSRLGMKG